MSKIFKIVLVLTIITCICINISLATDLEAEDSASDLQSQALTDSSEDTNSTSSDISAQVTKVAPLSNLPEANLGLNNILNVILISIGVLLILFAIAILIRLKKTNNQ